MGELVDFETRRWCASGWHERTHTCGGSGVAVCMDCGAREECCCEECDEFQRLIMETMRATDALIRRMDEPQD